MELTPGLAIAPAGPVYPVLEVYFKHPRSCRTFVARNCCFHDLLGAGVDDQELAGMGLCIIGNVCKMLDLSIIDMAMDAFIQIRHSSGSDPVAIPWPGMPGGEAVPLDLARMPFDPTMFLDPEDHTFKRRPDRLQLMNRIEAVWVPALKHALAFQMSSKR